MTSQDLRVGVIGFGVAGAFFHAPLVESTEGMALATVVTSNAERATAVGREYPGATIVGTADELFDAAADLDLVIVASTNDTHVAFARQAIEAGLPVVVDKPLAVGGDGAYDLVEFASARGVFLTVFQNRRWDSDFLTLRGVLESGRLGRVHRFESRFETWRPAVTGGWRESSDPALAGGVLVDLGAHLVDQAVQLFGPVHSVYGELANRRQRAEVDDDSLSLCATPTASDRICGPRRLPPNRDLGSECSVIAARSSRADTMYRSLSSALVFGRVSPDGQSRTKTWREY